MIIFVFIDFTVLQKRQALIIDQTGYICNCDNYDNYCEVEIFGVEGLWKGGIEIWVGDL